MSIEAPHIIVISFATAIAFCWLVLVTKKFHSDFTSGGLAGPQTVHAGEIPRVGGIGIMLSILIGASLVDGELALLMWQITAAAGLAFAAGVLEDVTGKINPKTRLFVSLLSGATFVYLSGITIPNIGIGWVDAMLGWWPLAAFLTVLAIATLINAVNIIDGLNGLSIGTCCFMAVAIACLAYGEGDFALAALALIYTASLAGVGMFNFPFGKVFVGDGGAYLMGAIIAILVILLPARNANISAFASLLIILYPFYEMSRSMLRRGFIGKNAMLPDSKHLHSFIYNGNIRLLNKDKTIVNYLSALITLSLPAFCAAWAVLFENSIIMLCIGIFIFAIAYETCFRIYAKVRRG